MEPFLPFERPIEQVEQQVRRHAWRVRQGQTDASRQLIEALERRARLRRQIYGRLGPWERVQLARHPRRPHGLRAAQVAFGELEPLRGDRSRADDSAIIGGVGRCLGRPVAVIACDRGDDKREAHRRNFGMPGPEGFRKAARILEFAERRKMPVVSFVDTPGAWPGVDSEHYAVAEAISRLLWKQAQVRTRTVSVVLGEGGSGGALALAMADRMLMMQYAYFSVISPEACASILWRDGARTPQAAEKLRLLPEDLLEFGIVDEIVPEPEGGAHRYPIEALCVLRDRIVEHLRELESLPLDQVMQARYVRYRNYGQVETEAPSP